MKHDALCKIGDEIGCSPEEAGRKLHNLKGQFYQELRKIKLKKSGNGADENYISKWIFFDSLKFLDIGIKKANSDSLNICENSSPLVSHFIVYSS